MAHIDAEMEDLLTLSMNQNFIPVVDDRNIFIGIIRRREIIEYFAKKYYSQQHIHHYGKNNISLSLAK